MEMIVKTHSGWKSKLAEPNETFSEGWRSKGQVAHMGRPTASFLFSTFTFLGAQTAMCTVQCPHHPTSPAILNPQFPFL